MHSYLEVVIVQFLTLEKSLLSSCFHVCLLFADSSQFFLFWQVFFFFFFTLHLLRFPWTLSSPQIPIIISHEVSRLFPQWENPLHNIHRHKYSMHYTLRTISYEENFHPRLSHSWVCVTQRPLQWLFPQVLNIMSAYLSEAGKIITVDFQFIQ